MNITAVGMPRYVSRARFSAEEKKTEPLIPPAIDLTNGTKTRREHLKLALKNLVMIPILPATLLIGLDQTPGMSVSITDYIAHDNPAMTRVLGEGFGHAGLCFSLHFVFNAGRHLWKSIVGDRK